MGHCAVMTMPSLSLDVMPHAPRPVWAEVPVDIEVPLDIERPVQVIMMPW
jgi:hypothetical protein